MADSNDARVFISYSTKDGAEFAKKLRLELKANFSIWQDIVALQGGRDWWSQIEDALRSKSLQHFLLVVTPAALASPVVRREIRLARLEGKTVSPIKGPEMPDLDTLPRWLGQIYDLDLSEHRTTLKRVLEGPSQQRRVPMMAPEPPAEFVERPMEFEALKARLLDPGTKDAIAITAALRGAGGYGKTTLAKALAHDDEIQDAYFDGILWGELGEQGHGRVLPLISDLVKLITGQQPEVSTMDGARAALAEALGDRRMLLIVDDVWQKRDLAPFLQGGRNTTRLVTTRFDNELPDDAVRQPVDNMRRGEARELIGGGLPKGQVRANGTALAALVDRLGEWALILKLANGFLRDRVSKNRILDGAVADLNNRLDKRGFSALGDPKAESYEDRHRSVSALMNTSLELLDEDKRVRFSELGIFPEDVDIPIGIVERLWLETGDLDEIDTEDLLNECFDLSLLLNLDLNERLLRFHDSVRQFLRDQAGRDGLAAQHESLLRAMEGMADADVEGTIEKQYYYQYLPMHLDAAGQRDALDRLLLDPGWLKAKLEVTKSPIMLVNDYEQFGVSEAHNLIGRTLRLIAGICTRDPRQLLPQLYGRLMASPPVMETGFVDRLAKELPLPSLITTRPSLTPPGAENARLEGLTDEVRALAVLPDGRLASGAYDKTIRLWDVATGAENACIQGHTGEVNALAVLPDGRLASGAYDKTIRLWDVATGAENARIEGHTGSVYALAVLPDGRVVSGSNDTTIRLWDVATGAESARLEGHTHEVSALAVLPDGRLASGAYDYTIRLWDVATGAENARIEGHTGSVYALAVLPDGRLASGADDHTIRLWDVNTGAESARIEGHTDRVLALAVLPDGRLASGAYDNTIRLWNVAGGEENLCLEVDGLVTTVIIAPDHQIIAGDSLGRLHWLNIVE